MNAELYLELLREAHLAAIQRGATLTGGTRLGLGERIDDGMQFNPETGRGDIPGAYSVPSESRELNVFADAALAEMKVGLTRQELVDVLVNQFNMPRSNLVYAWDIPTYAVMRDGQRQSELEPEFFTGNPLDPTSKGPMQHSTYRPNNWWAGRQGKDVSGQTIVSGLDLSKPVAKYPNAEGPMYEHTNPFIANSATGWGIEAALSAVLSPTGLKAGKRLLGPLVRAMPDLSAGILARFKGVARNPDDWVSPHAKPFDYEADIPDLFAEPSRLPPPVEPGPSYRSEFGDYPADWDHLLTPEELEARLAAERGGYDGDGNPLWEAEARAEGSYPEEGPPGTPDPKAESSLFAESLSASELTPEAMEQAIREHYTAAWESMTPRDRASWQQMGRMSAPDDLDGYLDGMVDNIVGGGTPLDPAIGWGNLPEGIERRAHEIASEGPPGTPRRKRPEGGWSSAEMGGDSVTDLPFEGPPGVEAAVQRVRASRGGADPAPFDDNWNDFIDAIVKDMEEVEGWDAQQLFRQGERDIRGEVSRHLRTGPPVHSQRGAFDQDSEFDQVVADAMSTEQGDLGRELWRRYLWDEIDRIRGGLPQGPATPTRGGFRPRGFEDGTKSVDRLQEPRPEMWGDNVGGGGEPPRRNNVFDGDFSYDGWDEERLLNRQAEIVDGADAGGWELTDEGDGGWLLYVEHFNIENELRLRRGQQPLPANPTDRVGSMHDAASRGEYFEWLAEVQLPFVRGGSFDQTQVVPLDDLDRHLDSVWEQMLGETDSSSLSFTDALKSLGSGAAIAGATAVTAQTLFPEQVEKVVSGLATFNDGWWSWIKEFPEHLDWVVRATGATLDGMEQGTRSMGSPVLDGLSDGFREEAGGWMGSLGGGAVPVMGRQDASMLKGLSKDLSEQGHNGQAMFPNDIRREIENGDAMIVGYRSDADYQRAVEESGQYGIEVDRHFWRKPNRKNIRPAEGQPWTSDNLKKLAATNYFYPDAGARRGPR